MFGDTVQWSLVTGTIKSLPLITEPGQANLHDFHSYHFLATVWLTSCWVSPYKHPPLFLTSGSLNTQFPLLRMLLTHTVPDIPLSCLSCSPSASRCQKFQPAISLLCELCLLSPLPGVAVCCFSHIIVFLTFSLHHTLQHVRELHPFNTVRKVIYLPFFLLITSACLRSRVAFCFTDGMLPDP